jgi:hypothetical protein
MLLHISVANQPIVVLLDSALTHNFVSTDVARRLGLPFHSSAGTQVPIADGAWVAYQGLARDVGIRISQEEFNIDCYNIPLTCYDMVLGATFLRMLGPILWDFDDSCMAFWHGGRHVLWRGLGWLRSDKPTSGRLYVVRGCGRTA